MALRVLLADESSTIKKVFQLALQDFGVDVRSVNIGLDVSSVAQTFKPDIIFADVLLQKKNGYDVSLEIKQTAPLKSIPIVLMWSGFMELDQDKFEASMANAQLEKPFDVAALRKLVTDLVPRTQAQNLSQYLTFPKLPEMQETPPALNEDTTDVSEEDFQQVPIPKMKSAQAEKFRVNLKPEELEPQHVPVEYEVPSEKIAASEIEDEKEDFAFRDGRSVVVELEDELVDQPGDEGEVNLPPPPNMSMTPGLAPQMSAAEIEKIIRAQSADVIESVVWKVVPELATQIIERELNRLLKERESHP